MDLVTILAMIVILFGVALMVTNSGNIKPKSFSIKRGSTNAKPS